MPNLASAKKALRQDIKRARRNMLVKAELKSLRVKFRKLADSKKQSEAAQVAVMLGKKFDKAVAKGVLKLNTASRYKSRMMKKLNALGK